MSSEIRHTYVGDLLVEVVAPSGQAATLHNQTGGAKRDLVASFDPSSAPALAALAGQPINDRWLLRVTDLAARDVGTLARWALKIAYG